MNRYQKLFARHGALLEIPETNSSLCQQQKPPNSETVSRPLESTGVRPDSYYATDRQSNNRKANASEEENLLESWDPMADDYKSYLNTLAINPRSEPYLTISEKLRLAPEEQADSEICQFFSRHGCCADRAYCDKLHVDPKDRKKIIEHLVKNRTCINYTFLSPVEIEPDSRVLLVTVTYVESPTNFYLVAPYGTMNFAQLTKEDVKFYVDRVQQNSVAKMKLDRCHEQLALLFDHDYRIDDLSSELYLGQIVACKLKNGRYFRAMVVNELEDYEAYELLLIDIGNKVILPRESIYDIKANFLDEPPMAINCRIEVKLPTAQHQGSLKREKAIAYFEDLTRAKTYLFCKINDYSDLDRIFTVDLYDLESRESVTEKLVNEKLADRLK